MSESTRIKKIIREISRIAKSEQQALALVSSFSNVDWQEEIDKDLVACSMCQGKFRYCDMTWRKKDADTELSYCPLCVQSQHPYKCHKCTKVFFASYDYSSYYCEHCRSKPCAACHIPYIPCYGHVNLICQACKNKRGLTWTWESEMQNRLAMHRKRASSRGLAATLTLAEWIETLEHFDWHCAYCPDSKYTDLDHFVPISKNGGTAKNNCVPSCSACNIKKSQSHPEDIIFISSEVVADIQRYLLLF
jgi:5-methylcytosine-specific restriction endonuclease McrA